MFALVVKLSSAKGNAVMYKRMVVAILTIAMGMLSGCATVQPVDLADEKALQPAKADLWVQLARERTGNWFKLLNTGEEAIEWRLRLIDSATGSLDLQTFLWLEDKTGLTVLRHVLDAADRGVRVRLLLDDLFTVGESDLITALHHHPNIQYRIYNPFGRRFDSIFLREVMNAAEFSRLDHRMHNKAMIADNRAAIPGGRNIADEYFGNHTTANFRDMEVLVGGAFDREHVFIGSTNLDPRSLHQNTEIGIFIQSEELNARLREKLAIDFDRRNAWHLQIDSDGKIIWVSDDAVLDELPADTAFQRLEDWFIGLLPLEEEL
jgi:phosphatidylserine/phosphatidylglycerophosphate/cardiolipin synthase-like enzyme